MEGNVKLLWFHMELLEEEKAVAQLVTRLYGLGALHVQPLSTVSRAGKPAVTVTVEVRNADAWKIGNALAREYGIARYHQITSAYTYQPVSSAERPIVVVHEEQQFGLTVRFDLIGTERDPLHVRVVADDLTRLEERMKQAFDVSVATDALRERLETLLTREDGFVLEWPA
jgi:hypothetical protein